MRTPLYRILILLIGSIHAIGTTQETEHLVTQQLSFEEYIGFVKKHHPLMKQAELTISIGAANLMKARGGFDPKIAIDFDRKKFKKTEYYDQLNATFKIPTWYGIEFKANFEENTGEFLDRSLTLPDGGLYSAGVSFSLARGFLTNKRMATLRKARFFRQQTKADRDLLVNKLLLEASNAYFRWVEANNEQGIYQRFLQNAEKRLHAIKQSVIAGDKAAIDSIEASIALQNRKLNLEAATLKNKKASLAVSNYLWLQDVPIELEDHVHPTVPDITKFEAIIRTEQFQNTAEFVANHPKLASLDAKIQGLKIDKRFKMNKLLPKIDLQYNFLSPDATPASGFDTANYKAFVDVAFPLFLRKERGDLRLAAIKLKDARFERMAASLKILNKIEASQAEITSLEAQNSLITNMVSDYTTLLKAEERKFSLGESSLFLINSREQKLIQAQLKENQLTIKQLMAIATYYNAIGSAI